MIEQPFTMKKGESKVIERIIADEHINYNHMILPENAGLPEHFSNSNVYMTVVKGTLSIGLDTQEINVYPEGTILKIPEGIKMNVKNLHKDILELIVIKAPTPK